LLEVIGGEQQAVGPVKAKPSNVLLDSFDVFGLFLYGIGIVEAQIAEAAEFGSDAEVKARQRCRS